MRDCYPSQSGYMCVLYEFTRNRSYIFNDTCVQNHTFRFSNTEEIVIATKGKKKKKKKKNYSCILWLRKTWNPLLVHRIVNTSPYQSYFFHTVSRHTKGRYEQGGLLPCMSHEAMGYYIQHIIYVPEHLVLVAWRR